MKKPIGTPRVLMHIEAETEDCTCKRLTRCGGVEYLDMRCPEHGADAGPQGRFHTHAVQVNRVSVGTMAS